MENNTPLSWQEFERVEMRVGTVIDAKVFEKARKPAYILQIDFGELGIRKTSAQITKLYVPTDLIGKQVIAVVNFPPKQIANIKSECLVLGAVGEEGEVTLLQPERMVKNGTRIA
jgi:tRNA-binding protein